MEDTKHIHISDYNYNLPDERIAKFPQHISLPCPITSSRAL